MVSVAFRLQVVASFSLGLLLKYIFFCHSVTLLKSVKKLKQTWHRKWTMREKCSFDEVYNNVAVFLTVHWASNAGRTYRVYIVAITDYALYILSDWHFLCIPWFKKKNYFLQINEKLDENVFIFSKYIYSLNILFYFV